MKLFATKTSYLCFAALAGLFGLFYLLADFGKALSGQCGLLQLVGAVVLCICILVKKSEISKFSALLVLAIALGQSVALLNWVVWYGVRPWVFGQQRNLGWVPLLLHTAFAAWGIFLALKVLSRPQQCARTEFDAI